MSDRLQPYTRILSSPAVYLTRMLIFLAFIGFLVTFLATKFLIVFQANPGLNGLIIMVLFWGVSYSFWQVIRIKPEIRWVNAFRIADPGLAISHQPVLLAPMATMLRDRTGALSLSTTSMRSIMDSIGSRLDDARDTGRYTVGLLVFLGLLGTFWGLLDTIQSFSKTINALDIVTNKSAIIFQDLKIGLARPLKGMGIAFSSSILGLSGSLIVGFLELQASHAHNRFYNELEEWLSGITELTPAGTLSFDSDQISRHMYSTIIETQRSLSELSDRIQSHAQMVSNDQDVKELIDGISRLIVEIRRDHQSIRKWEEERSKRQDEVMVAIRDLIAQSPRR